MVQPTVILYVDDSPLDRELVRDVLEKQNGGFRVIEATSRADFEARLAGDDYDLVLSDFNILGFDGLQVIEAVHAMHARMPVVMLTGTGSEEIAVEALKYGAADYVVKSPKYIQHLPLTIRAVLDRRRLEAEREQAMQALVENEQKYRTLFENMVQGVFYQRADGELVDCNSAALELFGLTREQFIGRTSLDPRWNVIHEDGSDFPGEQHPSMLALRTGRPVRNVVAGVFSPRKEAYVWLSIDAIPQFRTGEAEPYQVFVTLYDITERRQAEAQIAEQLDELRRWQAVTLGREGRILDLKREVNALLRRLGDPIRYPSVEPET